MSHITNYLVGVYNDDDEVLNAAWKLKDSGVKVHEVYSPFPIHGIDDALGYKRTRLDIAAFMFGTTGGTFAITMLCTMMGYDWPMNIGGKPFLALPDFVPVTFELTVLSTALGMVFTFMLASGLGPGSNKLVFDKRFSDDKFILAVNLDKNKGTSPESIKLILKETGAAEVSEREVSE